MTKVNCWQIDSFTDKPFKGNPAAVCWLEREMSTEWMQAVASEMNLSETAFVSRREDGYDLRWFTPNVEVELCGHATLASAHALWSEGLLPAEQSIQFHTQSGVLTCTQDAGLISMDFPATPAHAITTPFGLLESLEIVPIFIGQTQFDYLLVVEDEETVRNLSPDFAQLQKVSQRGVMVTSQATTRPYDFISRFFAPAAGINEDPVTGSAHCCLGPYWAEVLGKSSLTAYQASPRGGVVHMQIEEDRVHLKGQAVTVFRGELVTKDVDE